MRVDFGACEQPSSQDTLRDVLRGPCGPCGVKATISPVTITKDGPKWVTHNNDIWMRKSQGS